MRPATLEFLRCPYCGGRLELVDSLYHDRDGGEIRNGILACHCCIFPVVDGIPVLHLQEAATAARDQIQAGDPALARRTMFGLADAEAAAFDAAASSSTATFKDTVDALGPGFEGGYFLYRFSDPTFLVADAVVRSVARPVLDGSRRAIDICGGSGHLTRTLASLTSEPPVLADLYFAKVWLARRFTAPGCEPVCCDGNAPLPFARGAFGFAMCTDAFMYIWTKRQFVSDMERLVTPSEVDERGASAPPGAVLIGHTHNERAWSPSHGQPLSAQGYRDLFERLPPRVFGEAGLFADVVRGGPLDLSRRDDEATLDRDPALTIVATRHPAVYAPHPLDPVVPREAAGEFRLNPLYQATAEGTRVRLTLRFPSEDYADEYAASRKYLAPEAVVDGALLDRLPSRTADGPLEPLARQRLILDLPKRYY